MATLNIKNFPDDLYDKVKEHAERERRSVAQQVICILDRATEEQQALSILELQGLGKEYARALGASEHIRLERDSWDS